MNLAYHHLNQMHPRKHKIALVFRTKRIRNLFLSLKILMQISKNNVIPSHKYRSRNIVKDYNNLLTWTFKHLIMKLILLSLSFLTKFNQSKWLYLTLTFRMDKKILNFKIKTIINQFLNLSSFLTPKILLKKISAA
jgi:hypothetical protein